MAEPAALTSITRTAYLAPSGKAPIPAGSVKKNVNERIANRRRARTSKSTWIDIRRAYEKGEGSCRELAERFGINPWTVSTRCKRERWRDGHAKLEQKLAKHVDQALDRKAQTLAQRAAQFLNRSVDEAEDWLTRIDQAKQLLDAQDIPGLRDLVNSWRVVIETTRRSYGLDKEPPPVRQTTWVHDLSKIQVVVELPQEKGTSETESGQSSEGGD